MNMIAAAALLSVSAAQAAPAADWWWVAGDSKDDVAVFVDAETARLTGRTAAIDMVLVERSGARLTDTWRGRCDLPPSSEEMRAVAEFACGSDETRMSSAAMLGGLTPEEAARAIFGVGRSTPRAALIGPEPAGNPIFE